MLHILRWWPNVTWCWHCLFANLLHKCPRYIECILSSAASQTRKGTKHRSHFSLCTFVATWVPVFVVFRLAGIIQEFLKRFSVGPPLCGWPWSPFGAMEAVLEGRGTQRSSIISEIYLQTWYLDTRISKGLFGFISTGPQPLPTPTPGPNNASPCIIFIRILAKCPTVTYFYIYILTCSNLWRLEESLPHFREEEIKAQRN